MTVFTLFGYDFSVFDIFVLVLAAGYGFYALYTAFRLKKEPAFFDNKLLMPANDLTEKDCTDPEGYFKYLTPRLALFGLGLIILGLFDAVFPMIVVQNQWPYGVSLLGLIPIMALLVWYGIAMRKASIEYFS